MLLGCCHCGESDPPSESESDSIESIARETNDCATGTCIGGVFALRYKLTYNFGNPEYCGSLYQGDFVLHFRADASTGNQCRWFSDEKSICYFDEECVAIDTIPRFQLSMFKTRQTTGFIYHYRFLLIAEVGLTELGGECGRLSMEYLSQLTLPSAQFNCLSSFTLPILPTISNTTKNGFSSRITAEFSSHSDVPSSVTLTPT
jgi:hypothetical protein